MELIMEILIEIIFEGALESVTEKKFPIFFRVMAAVLLLTVYIGLTGILLYIGINNKSRIVIGIAIALFLTVAIVVVKKYKEINKK